MCRGDQLTRCVPQKINLSKIHQRWLQLLPAMGAVQGTAGVQGGRQQHIVLRTPNFRIGDSAAADILYHLYGAKALSTSEFKLGFKLFATSGLRVNILNITTRHDRIRDQAAASGSEHRRNH